MTTGHLRAHRVFLAPVLLMIALVACGGGSKELSAEEKRAQAIAEGNVALCNNGDFSNNTDFGKTCSGADGLDEWLAEYGECNDGTIIKMAKNSSCGGSGFKELKEAGFKPAPKAETKPTPKADDVALCNSGTYSNNTDFRATCSGGGGIDRWLAEYGECNDGTIIKMGASASCRDRDGFKGLKPEGFRPAPKADDVALCKSGTYSNNTDFAATCSGGGGIDHWLAEYGECNDGTIIKMSASSSCSGHSGFKELKPAGFEPPVATTTTTGVPAPTAPPAPQTAQALPGVRSEELVAWLRGGGWSCDNRSDFAELIFVQYCTRGLSMYEIFTPKNDPDSVLKVGVSASDRAGWGDLEQLAGYPIEGVSGDVARAWLASQIASVQQGAPISQSFGDVPYMLAGSGDMPGRNLEIGHELPFTDADWE